VISTVAGLHEQVVLTFQIGSRAKVESVYHFPVKVVFANDNIHDAILLMDGNNLLNEMYLVDIRVETVDDKPVLYKILRLHGRFITQDLFFDRQ
jgi:hypothetical protein